MRVSAIEIPCVQSDINVKCLGLCQEIVQLTFHLSTLGNKFLMPQYGSSFCSNPDLRTLPPELGNLRECWQLRLNKLNLQGIPKHVRPGMWPAL